jgi:hypothetical protein
MFYQQVLVFPNINLYLTFGFDLSFACMISNLGINSITVALRNDKKFNNF